MNPNYRGPAGSMSGQRMAGYDVVQQPNFTPEQMGLFQQLFSHVKPGSFLSQLAAGDEGQFEALEKPGYRMLNQNLGDLASRFSFGGGGGGGSGSVLGGRHGSGFQNAANQATVNFTEDMLSRRQGIQRNALKDLLEFSDTLLGKQPYDQYLVKPNRKRSFWESILGGAAPAAGAAIGGYFGGVPGAQLGGSLGSGFSQGFNQGY